MNCYPQRVLSRREIRHACGVLVILAVRMLDGSVRQIFEYRDA